MRFFCFVSAALCWTTLAKLVTSGNKACGNYPLLPGTELAVVGFNAVNGTDGQKGWPLFAVTYDQCKLWTNPLSNKTYLCADQISVPTGETIFSNYIAMTINREYSEYIDMVSHSYGLSVGVDAGVFSGKISWDHEDYHCHEQMSEENRFQGVSLSKWVIYTLESEPQFMLQLSPFMKQMVADMPSTPGPDADRIYGEATIAVGTHMKLQSDFGAKVDTSTFVDSKVVESHDISWSYNNIEAAFKLYNWDLSPHGHWNHSDISVDSEFFSHSNTTSYYYGGDITLASNITIKKWLATIDEEPAYINGTLDYLTELLNDGPKKTLWRAKIDAYLKTGNISTPLEAYLPQDWQSNHSIAKKSKRITKKSNHITKKSNHITAKQGEKPRHVRVISPASTPALTASTIPVIPGMNVVGCTFDHTTSEAKGWCPLVKTYALKNTYSPDPNNPTKRYLVPDQVIAQTTPEDLIVNGTFVMQTIEDYWKYTTTHSESSGGFLGMSSSSKDTYDFYEHHFEKDQGMSLSQLEVAFYTASIPPLTDSFKATPSALSQLLALTSVPFATNPHRYYNALEEWGTAIVASADMGGAVKVTQYWSSCFVSTYSAQWVVEQSNWGFLGLVGGHNDQQHAHNSMSKSYLSHSQVESVVRGGDTKAYNFSNPWTDWVPTIMSDPVAVGYRLVPLDFLLLDYPTARAQLQLALTAYSKRSLNQSNAKAAAAAKKDPHQCPTTVCKCDSGVGKNSASLPVNTTKQPPSPFPIRFTVGHHNFVHTNPSSNIQGQQDIAEFQSDPVVTGGGKPTVSAAPQPHPHPYPHPHPHVRVRVRESTDNVASSSSGFVLAPRRTLAEWSKVASSPAAEQMIAFASASAKKACPYANYSSTTSCPINPSMINDDDNTKSSFRSTAGAGGGEGRGPSYVQSNSNSLPVLPGLAGEGIDTVTRQVLLPLVEYTFTKNQTLRGRWVVPDCLYITPSFFASPNRTVGTYFEPSDFAQMVPLNGSGDISGGMLSLDPEIATLRSEYFKSNQAMAMVQDEYVAYTADLVDPEIDTIASQAIATLVAHANDSEVVNIFAQNFGFSYSCHGRFGGVVGQRTLAKTCMFSNVGQQAPSGFARNAQQDFAHSLNGGSAPPASSYTSFRSLGVLDYYGGDPTIIPTDPETFDKKIASIPDYAVLTGGKFCPLASLVKSSTTAAVLTSIQSVYLSAVAAQQKAAIAADAQSQIVAYEGPQQITTAAELLPMNVPNYGPLVGHAFKTSFETPAGKDGVWNFPDTEIQPNVFWCGFTQTCLRNATGAVAVQYTYSPSSPHPVDICTDFTPTTITGPYVTEGCSFPLKNPELTCCINTATLLINLPPFEGVAGGIGVENTCAGFASK